LGEKIVRSAVAVRYDAPPEVRPRIDTPMTRSQALRLRSLSAEAYQPNLFDKNLTQAEAERRIEALRAEIELANSF
jgi:hypothetical protein